MWLQRLIFGNHHSKLNPVQQRYIRTRATSIEPLNIPFGDHPVSKDHPLIMRTNKSYYPGEGWKGEHFARKLGIVYSKSDNPNNRLTLKVLRAVGARIIDESSVSKNGRFYDIPLYGDEAIELITSELRFNSTLINENTYVYHCLFDSLSDPRVLRKEMKFRVIPGNDELTYEQVEDNKLKIKPEYIDLIDTKKEFGKKFTK